MNFTSRPQTGSVIEFPLAIAPTRAIKESTIGAAEVVETSASTGVVGLTTFFGMTGARLII
ncbi:hypothetical protein R3I65_004814 [Salmonella enterica]|nr:hypothetical protein [Salmonella enterica]